MWPNLRPTADFIFAHSDGSVINPDYLSQVFDRHLGIAHDSAEPPSSYARLDPFERGRAAQSRERAFRPRQPAPPCVERHVRRSVRSAAGLGPRIEVASSVVAVAGEPHASQNDNHSERYGYGQFLEGCSPRGRFFTLR